MLKKVSTDLFCHNHANLKGEGFYCVTQKRCVLYLYLLKQRLYLLSQHRTAPTQKASGHTSVVLALCGSQMRVISSC